MLKQFKKSFHGLIYETYSVLKNFLLSVEGNNLRIALEAYSGGKVSAKFTKRMQEIAERNRSKGPQDISDEEILKYLDMDTKPMT